MALKGSEPSTALFVNSIKEERYLFEVHYYINPTVANTALSMAYGMGFKNIYFLGVDLAYRLDGNHHSKKSFYYNDKEGDLEMYTSTNQIKVKANLSNETLYTDSFFNTSKYVKPLCFMSPRLISNDSKLNFCKSHFPLNN